MIKTESIPQANSIRRVVQVVSVVAAGKSSTADIATALGCVERQGRYYRAAAESMRLIKEVGGDYVLTGLGKRLLAADGDPYRQQRVLREAMLKNPALKAIHEQLQTQRGKSAESLVRWLSKASGLNAATAARRLESVVNWLRFGGLVYEQDGRLKATPA